VTQQSGDPTLPPYRIELVEAEVEEQASINRSPTSYDANPEEERARWERGEGWVLNALNANRYASNLDTNMVQLNFYNAEDEPIGLLNWWEVSQLTNLILPPPKVRCPPELDEQHKPLHLWRQQGGRQFDDGEGDEPLVAGRRVTLRRRLRLDQPRRRLAQHGGSPLPGHRAGVRHRAQHLRRQVGNGATSPSVLSRTQMCIASGPGSDMFESTKIIGERQFLVARDLLQRPASRVAVEGPIQFIHQWVDMSQAGVLPTVDRLLDSLLTS
jgi:neutral ceramidase